MREGEFGVLDRYTPFVDAPTPSFDRFLGGRRRRQRHRRVAAGLALAVLVVAAGVFVDLGRGDGTSSHRPIGPGPVPTTTPASRSMLLLPAGRAPSRPASGEVVASIWFSHLNGDFGGWRLSQVYLYADGRLLWLDDEVPGGVAEQQIGVDEVGRVRREFLASGLFDPDQPVDEETWAACACFLWVRDGGQLRSTELPDPGLDRRHDAAIDRRVEALIDTVTSLSPSLPPGTDSPDPDLTPYVPTHYRVCVMRPTEHAPSPLPDAARVLRQRLPRELARLLAGVRPGVEPLSASLACDRLTTDATRRLAAGLIAEPDVEVAPDSGLGFSLPPRGAVHEAIYLTIAPILPHGETPGTSLGGT